MKPKSIAAVALLAFVAASIITLTVKSLRQSAQEQAGAAQIALVAAVGEPLPADGMVVYYFHSNTRCPTCQSIEANAREAVQSGFGQDLKAGSVQWRVLNYEQPQSQALAQRYQIAMPMVVLVRMGNGRETAWKALDQVWPLSGDKPALIKYVQDEARSYLEGQ